MSVQTLEYWTGKANGFEVLDLTSDETLKSSFIEYERTRYADTPKMERWFLRHITGANSMLEIGVGTGVDFKRIAEDVSLSVGIDLSPFNAKVAKRIQRLFGLDGELLVASAENLPFQENSFQRVYSNGVLHHIPDTQRGIDEARRVAREEFNCMLYHYWFATKARDTILRIRRKNLQGSPIEKTFTMRAMRLMFSGFQKTSIETESPNLSGGSFYERPAVLLVKIPVLRRRFGSFLMITGTK